MSEFEENWFLKNNLLFPQACQNLVHTIDIKYTIFFFNKASPAHMQGKTTPMIESNTAFNEL